MSNLLPPPAKWVLDTKQDPPVYSRPMFGTELMLHRAWSLFDGVNESCMGVNFTTSLGVEELRRRARQALDKLRFVSPLIACTTEDLTSPRWVYTPSADREAWLNLAFSVEDRGTSLNPSEFLNTVSTRQLPIEDEDGNTTLFRVYLLTTSTGAYGLYVHAPHSILDADPSISSLNLMCEWICGKGMDLTIVPSEEWRNLPVDPITATGGPAREWGTSGKTLLQDVTEQKARNTLMHTLPRPSLPESELDMSDPPLRFIATLSEAQSAAIVAQAKKLGVSVTALFHAAHGLAHFTLNPVPRGTEIDFPSDGTAVTLGRYMKPYVEPKTRMVSSCSLLPIRLPMAGLLMERTEKERLIATARALQGLFDKYVAHPCFPQLASALSIMPPSMHDRAMMISNPWRCAFVNVGVVESRLKTLHGEITIDSISFGNRQRTMMCVHLWTMNSKLHFQIQGTAAWGEECMKKVLEETIRIGSLVSRDAKL
ncbi:hypothetical protein JVU11DRAFT_5647 [Chiua virens]|nr:hypothetical protein JVU11DRAFT_5647 [Chiua virens]